MRFPENLKYTKDHEWALIDGNKATIGITDHAQSALGDVVFVDLPKVGREVKVGETFGVVESIKAVSDLYSPVAGKVTEVNAKLTDSPALINQDPHGGAWIVKMEITGGATSDKLLNAADYSKFVESI